LNGHFRCIPNYSEGNNYLLAEILFTVMVHHPYRKSSATRLFYDVTIIRCRYLRSDHPTWLNCGIRILWIVFFLTGSILLFSQNCLDFLVLFFILFFVSVFNIIYNTIHCDVIYFNVKRTCSYSEIIIIQRTRVKPFLNIFLWHTIFLFFNINKLYLKKVHYTYDLLYRNLHVHNKYLW